MTASEPMLQHVWQMLAWRLSGRPRGLVPNSPFDYLQLTSSCTTQNQFNRVHIVLENILTPAEFAAIAHLAKRPSFPEMGKAWVETTLSLTPALFDAPRRFERHAVSNYVILYQDPRVEISRKSLLVVFTGNARRPMMPIPMFLQYVDSRSWDVVVLKKCDRNSYLLGLEGSSTDFVGLVDHIRSEFCPARYRRLITYGTSAGGFAAICAAILLNGTRGISVGGGLPQEIPSFVTVLRDKAQGVDLRFVFGEEFLCDRLSAFALKDLFSGELCPVPNARGHAVVRHLLNRGKFREFIQGMLA